MAPSTPPPPSSDELAAFTMASTSCVVMSPATISITVVSLSHGHADRITRARKRMTELGVDVLLLSLGADLPYFTGYEAMPLERLTMLVLPRDGDATLVVPRLEAPRVVERPEAFTLLPWDETDDPVGIVAGLARTPGVAAIGRSEERRVGKEGRPQRARQTRTRE